jgi:hypothetical protein
LRPGFADPHQKICRRARTDRASGERCVNFMFRGFAGTVAIEHARKSQKMCNCTIYEVDLGRVIHGGTAREICDTKPRARL